LVCSSEKNIFERFPGKKKAETENRVFFSTLVEPVPPFSKGSDQSGFPWCKFVFVSTYMFLVPLVFTFWTPQNLHLNTKKTTGSKPCLLLRSICSQSPAVRRKILSPGCADIFSLQMLAILISWLVDNLFTCSLKENCLLRIEPQGHTLTPLCIGYIS